MADHADEAGIALVHPERAEVLALDLEATLISNVISQIPRPGLRGFLSRCREMFGRIVIFTAVGEEHFRSIARDLVAEDLAPAWFAGIEYVRWQGHTKDLHFVPGCRPGQVLLVDDYADYVHPGQEGQWIEVAPFDHVGDEDDRELFRVLHELEARVGQDLASAGPSRTMTPKEKSREAAHMREPAPIIIAQTFAAPRAVVWKAITEPAEMTSWYFDQIPDFRAEVGFVTRFTVHHAGREYRHVWTVTDVVPGERIAYTWEYAGLPGLGCTIWELTDASGATRLTLTNTGLHTFPQNDPSFSRESCEEGWRFFIGERLAAHLQGAAGT